MDMSMRAVSARTTFSNNIQTDKQAKVWHTVTDAKNIEHQVLSSDPMTAIEDFNSLQKYIKDGVMVIETEDQFDELKAIKNHLDKNASLDGCMFETFGDELDFVRSMNDENVWTYIEEDDALFMLSGYHHVNRLGYIVTELPYFGEPCTIKVCDLSEFGDNVEDEVVAEEVG